MISKMPKIHVIHLFVRPSISILRGHVFSYNWKSPRSDTIHFHPKMIRKRKQMFLTLTSVTVSVDFANFPVKPGGDLIFVCCESSRLPNLYTPASSDDPVWLHGKFIILTGFYTICPWATTVSYLNFESSGLQTLHTEYR